ncbi:MAG: hypothetical protein ACREH4_09650 [Vitreimonas sp.]
MPADALTLTLTGPLADDLRDAADACDMAVEEFVHAVLKREAAEAAEALGWNANIEEDLARMAEYDRTGEAIPAEEVFAWLESLSTDDPLPRPKARKLG